MNAHAVASYAFGTSAKKNEDFLRCLGLACAEQSMPKLRIPLTGAPADAASCVSPTGVPAPSEILLLQWALSNRSFDVGPLDGVFGDRTLAAIAGFETANRRLLTLSSNETRIQSRTLELLGVSCSLPREIQLLPTSTSATPPSTSNAVSIAAPAPQNPTTDAIQHFDNSQQQSNLGSSEGTALFIGGVATGFFAGLAAMFVRRRSQQTH